MPEHTPQRPVAAGFLAATILATFVSLIGCDRDGGNAKSSGSGDGGSGKVRIGVIGLTCEAPLYVAYEKGFFKEEGVEVELVKSDWRSLADSLSLGKLDATHHLVMYLLKPIEQGADLKITAGVHKGCLRVQAGTKSQINKPEDLKGKRIGIPNMGSPPHMFASRALAAMGMDPSKDVTWRSFPPQEMGMALDKGEVDAVATSEPIGTMLLKSDKVRNVIDQATDAPYKDEYCCAVVVSGKFASRDPAAAAKVTRAILKGAKWVQTNPTAAATLSVEKKHLASNPELNAQALSKLTYIPSVAGGREATGLAAQDMKKANLLSPTTDVAQLGQRAFLPLEGVTDEWLSGLKVEQVAGGGPAPEITGEQFVSLVEKGGHKPCCQVAK